MPEEQGPAEIEVTTDEPNTAEQIKNEGNGQGLVLRPRRATRKDKSRPHVMRHGMLSKYPLEVLISLGEDKKKLRRMERMFRDELQPKGIIGGLLFDEFWFFFLQGLLAARFAAVTHVVTPDDQAESIPSITVGPTPELVWDPDKSSGSKLQDVLFRQMALFERYDRHVSREMYRHLAAVIFLRDHGSDNLAEVIAHMVGTKTNSNGK